MNNHFRIEPLEEDELAFLQKKHDKESKAYMYGMNMLLLASILLPVFVGIVYYVRLHRTDLMVRSFLYALSLTLLFFTIVSFFSYRRSLFGLKKDIRLSTKIVESCLITEKKFMALNNTWHFLLNSAFKYSIEVSEADYERFAVNDEINIEYTRYSYEYFGYF